MTYKIVFDPKRGTWLVKIQNMFFLWDAVREDGEMLEFANYDKARVWVKATGLDNVYRDYMESPMMESYVRTGRQT